MIDLIWRKAVGIMKNSYSYLSRKITRRKNVFQLEALQVYLKKAISYFNSIFTVFQESLPLRKPLSVSEVGRRGETI